jgi:Transposase
LKQTESGLPVKDVCRQGGFSQPAFSKWRAKYSGVQDLMVSAADGTQVTCGLIDRPIVRLYLHTMTNGVLVGGDNSKMSVLEKLARLALEN